jgi:hypothetical protein
MVRMAGVIVTLRVPPPGAFRVGYFRVVVGSSGVAIQGEAKVEGDGMVGG